MLKLLGQTLAQLAEMPKLLGQTSWPGFEPQSLQFVCVNFQWLVISSMYKKKRYLDCLDLHLCLINAIKVVLAVVANEYLDYALLVIYLVVVSLSVLICLRVEFFYLPSWMCDVILLTGLVLVKARFLV
jgi:hypothetical protein